MLRLPVVMLNSRPDESLPGTSLTNGPIVRATSSLVLVSMRMTVAPKSAITRVVAGPAIAHVRSSTLIPSSGGRRPLSSSRSRSDARAAERCCANAVSVCSPRRGARPRRIGGCVDDHTHGPGAVTGRPEPSASSSTWSK